MTSEKKALEDIWLSLMEWAGSGTFQTQLCAAPCFCFIRNHSFYHSEKKKKGPLLWYPWLTNDNMALLFFFFFFFWVLLSISHVSCFCRLKDSVLASLNLNHQVLCILQLRYGSCTCYCLHSLMLIFIHHRSALQSIVTVISFSLWWSRCSQGRTKFMRSIWMYPRLQWFQKFYRMDWCGVVPKCLYCLWWHVGANYLGENSSFTHHIHM